MLIKNKKMNLIELTYILASIASVIVMYPQIKKLLLTKRSDELSLSTWGVWAICQFVALIYSLSLAAIPLILVNAVWITFYVAMLVLILKYRNNVPALITENYTSNPKDTPEK